MNAGGKLFRRSDGYNFMGPLKAHLFFKAFGQHDVAEHPLRWCIEIIGLRRFKPVLKIWNRDIAC